MTRLCSIGTVPSLVASGLLAASPCAMGHRGTHAVAHATDWGVADKDVQSSPDIDVASPSGYANMSVIGRPVTEAPTPGRLNAAAPPRW